jgi:hypothetical protein
MRSTTMPSSSGSSSTSTSRGGLGALLVSTIDSIFDTRPPPYRILYQRDFEDGQISFGLFNLKNFIYQFSSSTG